MRVTHAHPLNPAALAFVPFGIVLVRVRVFALRNRRGFLNAYDMAHIRPKSWSQQTPTFDAKETAQGVETVLNVTIVEAP